MLFAVDILAQVRFEQSKAGERGEQTVSGREQVASAPARGHLYNQVFK